jgi:drug/metabolite transporter (DMT)-like permease
VAIWGVTFVVVKDAVSRWPVFPFLAIRFWVSAISFAPLVVWERKSLGPADALPNRRTVRCGLLAGFALFLSYATQTVGIQKTTASTAAFLTSLFVLIVPMLHLARSKSLPARRELIAALLAMGGVAVFCRIATPGFHVGAALLVACAFFYAVQITVVGVLGKEGRPVAFTAIQIVVVAICCSIAALVSFFIQPPPAFDWHIVLAICFTGILASTVAFLIQTWVQRHISATRSAVTFTLEPVFATVAGVLLLDEKLSANVVLGGLMILAAVLSCSLPAKDTAPAGSVQNPNEENVQ